MAHWHAQQIRNEPDLQVVGLCDPLHSRTAYYKSSAGEGGLCRAGLRNEKLKTEVRIWVDPKQLPNVVQWKNPGYGDYVMGIEPSNCYVEGREKQKEYGLDYIEPFGTRTQDICVELV
jgi:hypothetical protein